MPDPRFHYAPIVAVAVSLHNPMWDVGWRISDVSEQRHRILSHPTSHFQHPTSSMADAVAYLESKTLDPGRRCPKTDGAL